MKKILFYLVALSIITTSCVSQKRYAELQRQCETENAKCKKEMRLLNGEVKTITDLYISSVSNAVKSHNMIDLLERELAKHISYGDSTYADKFKCDKNDYTGISITFSSLNHATSAPQAMLLSNKAVQDSIKTLCNSIRYEAIAEYSVRVAGVLDSTTIHTEPIWHELIQPICYEVWKDSLSNTYWALEVQGFNWNDFVENNIAEIIATEEMIERLVKRLNDKYKDENPEDYTGDRIYFHDDTVRPKLEANLFREILLNTIQKRGY